MPDNHKTHLAKTHPSGAQEWECLECGRLVIWQGLPLKIKNIVLVEGNPHVYHNGSTDSEALQFEVDMIDPEEKKLLDRWNSEFE